MTHTSLTARLPVPNKFTAELTRELANVFNHYAALLTAVHDGRIDGYLSAATVPSIALASMVFQTGDFVRNDTPVETGTAGSKYVILGWSCISAGTAGQWVQCRCFTGN